ncbi:hypothetical protein [Endozoicomonas sp. SCSIO W0465]|uniref:hypothetical protein n=1 Tax=Endozoicomonas sp. SCSIO W0465 TaxID=2918516 RepID=UPI0020752AF4|nr:hypothetical protein [Endozoicomonas sp. SCSIO W0465]USE39441.1 hypothetical protein MJO57_15500 [Endozoicomonas sp. SCSIO W0465]
MNIKSFIFLVASFFSISVFGADQKAWSDDQKVNVNQATIEQLDKGLGSFRVTDCSAMKIGQRP